MTAPVRMEQAGGRCAVSFVMAGNESLATLPKPTDGDVRLRNVPAHYACMSQFRGPPPTPEIVQRKRASVLGLLLKRGLEPLRGAETLTYGYHDPFATPNILRKNEVGVIVRPTSELRAAAVAMTRPKM